MKGKYIGRPKQISALMVTAGMICVCAGLAVGIVVFERSVWKKTYQMNEIGTELLEEHQYAEAAKVYQEVLRLDDDNANADRGLSDAYLGLARECTGEEAVGNYRRAIAYDIVNFSAYRELADLYLGEQKYEEAFHVLRDLNEQYSRMLSPEYLAGSIVRASSHE